MRHDQRDAILRKKNIAQALTNHYRRGDNGRMDAKTLIGEILSSGWTQVRIAHELGRTQSWVSDVAAGRYRTLRWDDGEKLRALHARVCAKAAA